MIQPQELRIGNYFINHKWRWEQVISIEDNNSMSVNGLSKEMINPIPITPEILERCGFEKCESDDVEERGIYAIQVDNNHSLYFDPTEDPKWYISLQWNNNHYKNSFWAQPEYLHQLQNLIHSLTNQELTFKTTNNE